MEKKLQSTTMQHLIEIEAHMKAEPPDLLTVLHMSSNDMAKTLQNIPESKFWGKPRKMIGTKTTKIEEMLNQACSQARYCLSK